MPDLEPQSSRQNLFTRSDLGLDHNSKDSPVELGTGGTETPSYALTEAVPLGDLFIHYSSLEEAIDIGASMANNAGFSARPAQSHTKSERIRTTQIGLDFKQTRLSVMSSDLSGEMR